MAARPDSVYIYVMGTLDGPSKVGYSMTPTRRLKDIRRKYPKWDIFVVGTWPVGRAVALSVERYIQWKLRVKHIRKEWFDAERAEILSTIRQALDREDEFEQRVSIPSLDSLCVVPRFGEHIKTAYPKGTHGRIVAVLGDAEVQAAFIREAVDRELKRREKAKDK